MNDLASLTIRQLSQEMQAGRLTATELTEYYLERSERLQPTINGYISLTRDKAVATAGHVDSLRRQNRELSPLAGIPMAVKDNIAVRGAATTCASKVLADYISPYDATAVEKLAHCPLLGKANMDEFAMGSSSLTSAFGPVANPWDSKRSPGGSSGGSAALVAAGCAPFSLGTDTGGSIRQPAAFCGVTGFKPSYGRVSRRGLLPLAPSLDQIGTLTRSVEDAALVLQEICGYDPGDPASARQDVPDFSACLVDDVSGLALGLPREILESCPDSSTSEAVEEAARKFAQAGAKVSWVSMPYTDESLAAYMLIATAEAASSLARYDGVAYGYRHSSSTLEEMYTGSRIFGAEVRRRLMLGTYNLGPDCSGYELGQQARKHISRHLEELFSQVDLLLLPAAPYIAFPLEEELDPLAMYYNDVYSIPANLAGLPALALPCGESRGLPIGMQMMAPRFREDVLLRAGYTWQCRSDWHLRRPREVE
jgi:aspartyl-tRNA(Asn)/glutamyl-tRNA(Gln) amidotransferase subunit A